MLTRDDIIQERRALGRALHDAIRLGFRAISQAIDAKYGPKALNYREHHNMGDYKGPEEHRDVVYLRFVWHHDIFATAARHLQRIEDPQYRAEQWFRKLKDKFLTETPKAKFNYSALPQEARDALKQSVEEVMQVLDDFEAGHFRPKPRHRSLDAEETGRRQEM